MLPPRTASARAPGFLEERIGIGMAVGEASRGCRGQCECRDGVARHAPARYARAVARRIFRFDSYSIDLATRELRHAGELVVLSPKVFDCIAWLIEHRDRAVGRDELGAAIWGKADVVDTQLVQTVLKARRAIGDTGEEQRAIRTIPRFGYRWVAEVDAEGPAAPETALAAAPPASPDADPPQAPTARRARSFRARWPIAALVVLALVAAGATWSFLRQAPTRPVERDAATVQPTVAVLPAAIGAERDWTWLRLGVMDLVAERLRDAGLAVVPSDNVVSLLRDKGEAEAAERIVRQAVAPQWIVAPVVRRNATGWVVGIELRNADGQSRMIEIADADPVVAARRAVGGLLPALGKTDVPSGEVADSLVSRVRAALLGSDFLAAQRQLDAAAPAQREMPEIRLLQAQTDFGLGRFESARERFTQLLDALGHEGDPLLRARAEKGRAASRVRLSDLRGAERDYDSALALLRDRSEPALEGQIYSGRGVARALRGDDDDGAMADFARARIALQLAGDTLAMAGVEMNEGALKGRLGRAGEALASFRAAEQHFARFDSRSNLAAALANQIEAHLALLEPARALEVSDRGQAVAARLADPSVGRLLAYWRASALAAVGRLAEAEEELDALIHLPDAVDDVGIQAMSRSRKAALALATGRLENAVALARDALARTTDGPWKEVRSEAWLTLIRALRGEGNAVEAAAETTRFSDWARALADPAVAVAVRLAQAEQAWGDRREEVAAATYAEALALAERFTVPAEIARVAVSWSTTLIAEGKLEAAGPVVGRLARWSGSDYSCALLQARLYRALGQRAAWQDALAQARARAGARALPAAVTAEPDGDALASRR